MHGHEIRTRLRTALAETTRRLGEAGVPSPSVDARALIAHAAGTEQPLVMLDELPQGFTQRLEQLTVRRERREPLQLILGRAPFRRLMLDVEPGVFIPRPETELALDLLREHTTGPLTEVVDLCAGSGALGAAVLDEIPGARVLAVEIDPAAAALTRRNLDRAGPGRGRVLEADLCAEVPELAAAAPVDAVLSNPPYIPPEAVPRDAEVREHDPHRALFGGGPDGLEVPRAVLDWARRLLRPGGVLVMEHADVQGAAAREAAAVNGGFDQLSTLPDLTGRDRFLVARRAPGEAPSGSERLSR
ncbi:protein-(glutamine-N5) methyltransferase, release factor-specific [Brachybacterium faecium DSM 4810]|uniref:peptide chain release factor N(5)-glutamine methyltransferase n=1 Tax=Brachybacterium faecium (strain ATCC 43885 / DSM 4810 / JCM 11609 / LMG 19847 / NBRC 14762 / NCIMB 9860 / 6-10) TaxID=446465 RepID=C7MDT2_BRAFD|nr:peptide chain release factor N(5)-glutamine methyltransferase [Brachybacterium faecium]ACU85739.1 protein-(glutamine-N5) methyltransferase, release factor-specific [Brachybacterium faecium DSM 4810]HJG50736.1 peptide chain release factor N(5)-glutamine methyltransferase [Brachybacterium faecium]